MLKKLFWWLSWSRRDVDISLNIRIVDRFPAVGINEFSFVVHISDDKLSFVRIVGDHSSYMSCVDPSGTMLIDYKRVCSWGLSYFESCFGGVVVSLVGISTKRSDLFVFAYIWEDFWCDNCGSPSTVSSVESVGYRFFEDSLTDNFGMGFSRSSATTAGCFLG